MEIAFPVGVGSASGDGVCGICFPCGGILICTGALVEGGSGSLGVFVKLASDMLIGAGFISRFATLNDGADGKLRGDGFSFGGEMNLAGTGSGAPHTSAAGSLSLRTTSGGTSMRITVCLAI